MSEPVIIVEYDPSWPSKFDELKTELLGVVGRWNPAIEHVGSTSVSGLAAKPIIDIMVGVPDESLVDMSAEDDGGMGAGVDVEPAGNVEHVALVSAVKSLGFIYRCENGIPGRMLFTLPKDGPRRCHIHMVVKDDTFWHEHLLFRDYLRTNAEEAKAYGDLKRRLAGEFNTDRQGYNEAKTEFIEGCKRKAREQL
ncbi:GrpB family protein [Planctomycetota bacterium]|nr:GrpB family protein [Planctomycetota bacterium]